MQTTDKLMEYIQDSPSPYHAAAAAAALLILSGCAVGPNYTRPSAVSQMPAQFKEAPAG